MSDGTIILIFTLVAVAGYTLLILTKSGFIAEYTVGVVFLAFILGFVMVNKPLFNGSNKEAKEIGDIEYNINIEEAQINIRE